MCSESNYQEQYVNYVNYVNYVTVHGYPWLIVPEEKTSAFNPECMKHAGISVVYRLSHVHTKFNLFKLKREYKATVLEFWYLYDENKTEIGQMEVGNCITFEISNWQYHRTRAKQKIYHEQEIMEL